MLHLSLLPYPGSKPYKELVAQLSPSVSRHGPSMTTCAAAGTARDASAASIHSPRSSPDNGGTATPVRCVAGLLSSRSRADLSSCVDEPAGYGAVMDNVCVPVRTRHASGGSGMSREAQPRQICTLGRHGQKADCLLARRINRPASNMGEGAAAAGTHRARGLWRWLADRMLPKVG